MQICRCGKLLIIGRCSQTIRRLVILPTCEYARTPSGLLNFRFMFPDVGTPILSLCFIENTKEIQRGISSSSTSSSDVYELSILNRTMTHLYSVHAAFWLCRGNFVDSKPLLPRLTHMDDLNPKDTFVAVESAVKALADQKNLYPCLWGYLEDEKWMQLTEENIRTFISCWTDTVGNNMRLSVHLREAFVWLDSTCLQLKLGWLSEQAVFHAIGRLLQDPVSGKARKAIFFSGSKPVDFSLENMGYLLEATTANCAFWEPLQFKILTAWPRAAEVKWQERSADEKKQQASCACRTFFGIGTWRKTMCLLWDFGCFLSSVESCPKNFFCHIKTSWIPWQRFGSIFRSAVTRSKDGLPTLPKEKDSCRPKLAPLHPRGFCGLIAQKNEESNTQNQFFATTLQLWQFSFIFRRMFLERDGLGLWFSPSESSGRCHWKTSSQMGQNQLGTLGPGKKCNAF